MRKRVTYVVSDGNTTLEIAPTRSFVNVALWEGGGYIQLTLDLEQATDLARTLVDGIEAARGGQLA